MARSARETSDSAIISHAGVSPAEVRNHFDPGDATQQYFRYQHEYGVMLLVAGRRGVRPYVAIWCEHHEDLLAERIDGRFDGYQVKTSRPEGGAWRTTSDEFVKSIGRFADLVAEFGEAIAELYFVSNTEMDRITSASHDERRRGRCPGLFLDHVRACTSVASLAAPFDDAFRELVESCACSPELLLAVLRRVDVIRGPSRGDVDAVLSHEHLAKLPELVEATAEELDVVRDTLTAAVFRASSLQVTDPIRHLRPLLAPPDGDPVLAAKRIMIAELDAFLGRPVLASEPHAVPPPATFRYTGAPTLRLGGEHPSTVLRQKLARGGLDADLIDDLAVMERAAEVNLLEDVERRPELYPALLRQLEGVVLSECRQAFLRAGASQAALLTNPAGGAQMSVPFGGPMLIEVQDRMRRLAEERPHMVGGHEPECLLGIVGMLTAECRLWWSERFPVQEDAA